MEREKLAYVAGLFDGEGCVSLSRTRSAYFIRVLLVNTNLQILEWLQSEFGGDIKQLSGCKKHWKQSYCWRLSWTKAIEFLKAIEPWIRIKAPQLQVAIAWDNVRPGKGGRWDHGILKSLKVELHSLNKRGLEIHAIT